MGTTSSVEESVRKGIHWTSKFYIVIGWEGASQNSCIAYPLPLSLYALDYNLSFCLTQGTKNCEIESTRIVKEEESPKVFAPKKYIRPIFVRLDWSTV